MYCTISIHVHVTKERVGKLYYDNITANIQPSLYQLVNLTSLQKNHKQVYLMLYMYMYMYCISINSYCSLKFSDDNFSRLSL